MQRLFPTRLPITSHSNTHSENPVSILTGFFYFFYHLSTKALGQELSHAFDIRISGEHARVILSGDVDLQTTSDLEAEITKISGVQHLEIDASSVTYIDSSGVAVLLMARQFRSTKYPTLIAIYQLCCASRS